MIAQNENNSTVKIFQIMVTGRVFMMSLLASCSGTPLSQLTLVQRCLSDQSFLVFICNMGPSIQVQSTPLIKDTLVPAPLSFIEGVSSTEGFWSSSSYMLLYHHLGTSEAELNLSEGTRLCIC